MTIVSTSRPVTGGVDTHLDVKVAAVLDGIGGLLGVESFQATVKGNEKLLGWMAGFGKVARVGGGRDQLLWGEPDAAPASRGHAFYGPSLSCRNPRRRPTRKLENDPLTSLGASITGNRRRSVPPFDSVT